MVNRRENTGPKPEVPDIEKIENYLVEKFSRENTRTLVFFSSGDKLWEALDFEFYVPSQIKITSGAFTKPLEDVLKNYHRYLVIAADHKKATVFTVNLGEIEEKIEIVDDQVPQRVKVKKVDYNKDNIIFRHIEDHLHRHLKLIAEKAGHFASGKEIDFIIVAGHKELLNKIKQHLLYPLDKKPVSELVTDVNIPLNEILIKSKEVAVEFNQGGR